jgi:hypothetical protein
MYVILHGRFYKDLLPDLIDQLQGSKQDQAVEAWLKVDRAVRTIGPYYSVKFDDPVIHSTIEGMGGWMHINDFPEHEWKWKRKEFEDLYKVVSRKKSHIEYLTGITEAENRIKGFEKFIEPPKEITSLPSGGEKMVEAKREKGKAISIVAGRVKGQ